MTDPVSIKGGFRLELNQNVRDAQGQIDFGNVVTKDQFSKLIEHAKKDNPDFDTAKSKFEFRLVESGDKVYLDFKERTAGGLVKARLSIGSDRRATERDNAIKALSNTFGLNISGLVYAKGLLNSKTNYDAATAFQGMVHQKYVEHKAQEELESVSPPPDPATSPPEGSSQVPKFKTESIKQNGSKSSQIENGKYAYGVALPGRIAEKIFSKINPDGNVLTREEVDERRGTFKIGQKAFLNSLSYGVQQREATLDIKANGARVYGNKPLEEFVRSGEWREKVTGSVGGDIKRVRPELFKSKIDSYQSYNLGLHKKLETLFMSKLAPSQEDIDQVIQENQTRLYKTGNEIPEEYRNLKPDLAADDYSDRPDSSFGAAFGNILNYAEKKGPHVTPSPVDYAMAHIQGVNMFNVTDINELVQSIPPEYLTQGGNTSRAELIQSIVTAYNNGKTYNY